MVIGRVGHVPMSPINAYFHLESDLKGLEFKGVNYPVYYIKLASASSGDTNWSNLIESGFLGPTGAGSFTNDSYFEFDDIWRLPCGFFAMISPAQFPLLDIVGVNILEGIGMWGLPEDPTDLWASGWVFDPYDNDFVYHLSDHHHWTAFDTADPDSFSMTNHHMTSWAASLPFDEYPLFGGRGIACRLGMNHTGIVRWARPLPYPGFSPRERR